MSSTTNIISTNDRQFTCNLESCAFNPVKLHQTFGALELEGSFLDIDNIRANISDVSSAVTKAVKDFTQWVLMKESEFELKYMSHEVPGDLSLFNRINVVILRLRRSKNLLNAWYSNFHSLVSEAISRLTQYSEALTMLRSNSINITSFTQNSLSLAKQNISKVKSIQKSMKILLRSEIRLKTLMVRIQSEIEAFFNGYININGQLLNLNQFEELIGSLTNDSSPLVNIQNNLANIINSNTQSLKYDSSNPKPIHIPDSTTTNCTLNSCTSESTVDEIVERLRNIRNYILYTETTKPRIQNIAKIVDKLVKSDDPRYTEIQALFDDIRSKTPNNVINYYRSRVRDYDMIYYNLQMLERLLKNIDPEDLIYKDALEKIYNEMNAEAKNYADRDISGDDDDGDDDDGGMDDERDGLRMDLSESFA